MALKVEFIAQLISGMNMSQLKVFNLPLYIRKIRRIRTFCLSTSPFEAGWYGVTSNLLTPCIAQSFAIAWLQNSLALSDNNAKGVPYVAKTILNASAIPSDCLFGRANSRTNRVKKSLMTIIYGFPRSVMGSGPSKSIEILSKGLSGIGYFLEGTGLGGRPL